MGRIPAFAQRHEVNEDDAAAGAGELGFEDEPIPRVATADFHFSSGSGRCDQPTTVAFVTEECRKARPRVEARPAQPIDRAIVGDERRRLAISNERVVLDPTGHERSNLRTQRSSGCLRPGAEASDAGHSNLSRVRRWSAISSTPRPAAPWIIRWSSAEENCDRLNCLAMYSTFPFSLLEYSSNICTRKSHDPDVSVRQRMGRVWTPDNVDPPEAEGPSL